MILLPILLALAKSATANPSSSDDSPYLPNRFIVEFEDPPALSKRSLLGDPADAFVGLLTARGHALSASTAFSYNEADEIFAGASINADHPYDSDQDLLAQLKLYPEVKNVWPVRRLKTMTSTYSPTDSSDYPQGSTTTTIPDFNSNSSQHYPQWSSHSVTGVDILHSQNITGKGITIGIIDSGTYFLDPVLGGGFGSDYKVAGGWNFFGNVYDPSIQGYGVPNNNTLDTLGHGSFVAGVAAAAENSDFVGVAPDASIMSYRVFASTESTSEDVVLAALQRAYTDNVDVINLSIGSDGGGFPGNALSLVADRIAATGIVVVSSAGNSGTGGPFEGNNAATGNLTLSVGSTSTGQIVGYEAVAIASSGDEYRFTFTQPKGVQLNVTGSFDLTVVNTNACVASPDSGDSSTAIIFPQGNCTGYPFYHATHDLGYGLVLSYQDTDTNSLASAATAPTQYFEDSVFRLNVEPGLGQWVESQVKQGHSVSLGFDDSSKTPRSLVTSKAINLSYFSSLGPDYSGNLYPLVSAPGENIYSTWLNYSRSVQEGTSFSAPYVTGLVALYLQSLGGRPANDSTFVPGLRSRLIQTASALTLDDGTLAPLIGQGAGLINATAFVNTKSVFTTSPILNFGLNSSATTNSVSISLYNGNDDPVTYTFSHAHASTILAKSSAGRIFGYYQPTVQATANVTFDTSSITIQGHSAASLLVSVGIPDSVQASYSPIFQGKLVASGSNGEQVSLPYIATVTDNYKVFSDEHQPVFIYNGNEAAVLTQKSQDDLTDNIPLLNSSSNAVLYSPLLAGVSQYSVAVVAENYNFTLPITNGQAGVVTQLTGFPVTQMSRSLAGFYARVSVPGIPSGTYRMLAAALPAIPNLVANQTTTDDWQVWLSTPFKYNSTGAATVSGARSALAADLGTDLGGILVLQPSLRSANSNNTINIAPRDTLQVSIPFQALNGFKVGFKFNVTLPSQFTNFPDTFKVYQRSGKAILSVSINNTTNILQATVLADPQKTLITGSIIFGCGLKNPDQYTQHTQLPILFYSPNFPRYWSTSILDLAPADSAFPSLATSSSATLPAVYAYVPAAFTGWSNLSLNVTIPGYSFDCSSVSALQSLQLAFNDTTSQSQFAAFSVASCSAGAAQIVLENPPQSGQNVRVELPLRTAGPLILKQVPIVGSFSGQLAGSTSFSYSVAQKLNNVGLASYSKPMSGHPKLVVSSSS
ncbi:uncharacterized protein SAPINGB_P006061 [Magnusiomyces paraingens]|uniref:Peptidase S8/S53 domain-containing protein n=1 Tax=Magnusiomyces paraingens TaxID=2606893 RepID=A0A5E8C879_9ASCO|nr:uncharacterized protein SAPINGB_P006061 [Saprochaete ingens]VVT58148.1 unnamed protein product [Saprochaete ingens]